MRINTALRLVLKALQFVASLFIVISVAKVGPQWLLLICLIFVPPFTAYVTLQCPSPSSTSHFSTVSSLSELRASRRCLRAEGSIGASMAVVSVALAAILAFGYHNLANPRALLHACAASAALCLFYTLDVFLVFLRLRSATVHFALLRPPKVLPSSPLASPLSLTLDALHPCHLHCHHHGSSIDRSPCMSSRPPSAIQSFSIPRVVPRTRPQHYASPPPRPSDIPRPPPPYGHRRQHSEHAVQLQRFDHDQPLYCVPPSTGSSRPPSSVSSCSLHLGDGYTSNSTLTQEVAIVLTAEDHEETSK